VTPPRRTSFSSKPALRLRIHNGARPADRPVLQAIKFELLINLQTVKPLDTEIPHMLLADAHEVID
jgi:ABC-type uncharacterized transport system substrate-binding protein